MSDRMKWLALIGLVAVVAGCDSDDGAATSAIEIRMVPVQAQKVMGDASTDPTAAARIVRLTVEGPGMESKSLAYDFLQRDDGELPVFPEGYDRQVTVELCSLRCDENVAGDILSRGRSVPTTLLKGDKSVRSVFVAPRNAMVPPWSLADDGMTFQVSAMINKERVGATVTPLDDGRLLIVGGARKKAEADTWYMPADIDRVFDDAEIFDPRTGKFSKTKGGLAVGRAFHQAVKLGGPNKKDGKVLIIGGLTRETGSIKPSANIEMFDPLRDRFEPVADGLAGGGRALFTAHLVYPDQGVILILGGLADPGIVGGTWHLYKAGTGTIGAGPLMGSTDGQTGQVRYNHTMTLVDGYGGASGGAAYLVIGGENAGGTIADVEAFRVETDRFAVTADPDLEAVLPTGGRTLHSSVFVPSLGLVYVIGGFQGGGLADPSNRVEIFWNGTRSFQGETGMFLGVARGAASAVLMDNASILVAGGYGASGAVLATDVLVVNKECWQEGEPPVERCGRVPRVFADKTPGLDVARAGALGVFDSTRRVMLLGGLSDGGTVPDPILYNPD